METLEKLNKVKGSEIIEETETNIKKTILNIINQNSFIVSAINKITYENVKIVNVKGSFEITQNNNACVIMDEQFNNELTDNINNTIVEDFYNNIIDNLDIRSLEDIENNAIKGNVELITSFGNYENITNDSYLYIFNIIKNRIDKEDITDIINKQCTNAEQFNILNIHDSSFGFESSQTMTKEEYEKRTLNLSVVNKQSNTTRLLISYILKNLQISDIFDDVINDLQNYETLKEKQKEDEKKEEKKKKKEERKEDEEKKEKEDGEEKKIMEKENKNKKFKYIITVLFIVLILIFILLLIKKLFLNRQL